ncbi:MAG: COP23 domain-containing protein [Calothrix sp. MO_192.B10]|nr:COP23 domain-containing protein [Calothrix sp. MO_192.B10]
MKIKLSAQILSMMAVTLATTATFNQPSYGQTAKFFCSISKGIPSTFVTTSRGNIPIIQWKHGFGDRWTPGKRCGTVTRRFNYFYDNGTLRYIRAGILNNQPVLCVASYRKGSCLKNGVLVTLKKGTNPHSVLHRLLNKSATAGGRTVELENPISYTGGATYLDVTKLIGNEETTRDNKICKGAAWEC